MADGNTLTERISFEVNAPYSAAKLKGITEATSRLERMQVVWNKLQSSMTAMAAPVVIQKSMNDVLKSMENAGGRAFGLKGVNLKPDALAKQLVLPVQQFSNYLQQALLGGSSKELKAIQAKARRAFDAGKGEFRNPRAAAEWVSYYTKQYPKAANPYEVMQKIFGAGPAQATGAAAPPPPQNFGQRMAADRKAKQAAGTSPQPSPQGGEGEAKAPTKAQTLANARADIERKLAADLNTATETTGQFPSGLRSRRKLAGYYRNAASQMRELVGDNDSTAGKNALKWAENQERTSKEIIQKSNDQVAKQVQATVAATDRAEKARQKQAQKKEADAKKKQEAESKAALDPQHLAYLNRTRKEEEIRQARLDRNLQERREHAQKTSAVRAREDELKGMGARVVGGGKGNKPFTLYEYDDHGMPRQERIQYGKNPANTFRYLRPEKATASRWDKAVQGLSLPNMAANILKVTEWAAAVGVLYKSVELLQYSLKRMEDTGMEMAHLSIVFRGVGGSVSELTNDMIKLASAQGRSTDETMNSAVEWARLGGDRKTINEEVRVSAEAANIANMHMGETSKQLMSLMHIYNLEAGDLQGTLGGLVNTSLKYNVTLEEMFTGLDRSAAAAKVAGVGLAELQSMIAVVVGATGATGSMTGNSLKYIFQELPKAGVQAQLRGLGIEPLANSLEQKPAMQLLSELSGVWGTLGSGAQQKLSTTLGGRFNAARVPIVLEKMPEILNLAIDSQLHLNAAQEANVKILDTLKAQLAGLKAEWDRLVVSGGGGMRFSITVTSALKNLTGDLADGLAAHGLTDEQIQKSKHEDFKKLHNSPSAVERYGMVPKVMLASSLRMNGLQTLAGTYANQMPAWLGAGYAEKFYRWEKSRAGLVDVWNMGHEKEATAPGQDEYESKLSGLNANAGANALRVMQFNGAVARLKNHTLTQGAANLFATTMQGMQDANGQAMATGFLNDRSQGNDAGALAIATQARDRAQADWDKYLTEKSTLLRQRHDDLTAQQAANQKQQGDLLAGGAQQDDPRLVKLREDLGPLRKALSENDAAVAEADEAWQTFLGTIDSVGEALKYFGGEMKTMDAVVGSLEKWQELTPAVTPLQALAREAAAATDQLAVLKAMQASFDAGSAGGDLNKKMAKGEVDIKFEQMIQEAKNRLDSAQDPVRNMMARKLTEQMGGARGAQNLALENDYGIDNAAKGLNQMRALQADRERTLRELSQHPGDGALTGRMQQEDTDLWQTKVNLAKQFAEVNRDIKQLAIDQNKEFMRSFYGDGPAQMLQKLAAFRMAFNGDGSKKSALSQGAFFGLSPGMRQDYGQLNPQYNPHMIELQNERNRLNKTRGQWENPGSPGAAPGSGMASAIQQWDALKKMGGTAADVLTDVANGLRSSGNSLVMVVANLAQRLASIVPATATPGVVQGGHLPASPQSGGVGGAKGFTATGGLLKGKFIEAW